MPRRLWDVKGDFKETFLRQERRGDKVLGVGQSGRQGLAGTEADQRKAAGDSQDRCGCLQYVLETVRAAFRMLPAQAQDRKESRQIRKVQCGAVVGWCCLIK